MALDLPPTGPRQASEILDQGTNIGAQPHDDASVKIPLLERSAPLAKKGLDGLDQSFKRLASVPRQTSMMVQASESDASYMTQLDTLDSDQFPPVKVDGHWPMREGTVLEIPVEIQVAESAHHNADALDSSMSDVASPQSVSSGRTAAQVQQKIESLGGVALFPDARIALIGFNDQEVHLFRSILNDQGILKIGDYIGPEGGDKQDLAHYAFETTGILSAVQDSLDYDPAQDEVFPILQLRLDDTQQKSDPLPKHPEQGVKLDARPLTVLLRSPNNLPEVSEDLPKAERRAVRRENVANYAKTFLTSLAYIREHLEFQHQDDGLSSLGSDFSKEQPSWETLGKY